MGARLECRSTLARDMIRCRSHIGTSSKSGEITAMSMSLHSSGEPLAYEPYRITASILTVLLTRATNSAMILSKSEAVVTTQTTPGSNHSIPLPPLDYTAIRLQDIDLGISGPSDRPEGYAIARELLDQAHRRASPDCGPEGVYPFRVAPSRSPSSTFRVIAGSRRPSVDRSRALEQRKPFASRSQQLPPTVPSPASCPHGRRSRTGQANVHD